MLKNFVESWFENTANTGGLKFKYYPTPILKWVFLLFLPYIVFPSNSSTTENNIEQPKRFCTESTPISWMSSEDQNRPEDNDEDLKPTREDGSRDDHPSDASNNSSSDEGDEDLLQGLIKQAWAPKSHKVSGGQPFGAAKV